MSLFNLIYCILSVINREALVRKHRLYKLFECKYIEGIIVNNENINEWSSSKVWQLGRRKYMTLH
jgi:hypothetical protein